MNYLLLIFNLVMVIAPVFVFYNIEQANVHHKNPRFTIRPYGFLIFLKIDLFKKISQIKMGSEWTVSIILWFIYYIYLISSYLHFIEDVSLKIISTTIIFFLILTLIRASICNLDYYVLEKFLHNFDINVIKGIATLEDYQKLSVIGKKLANTILTDNKNFKAILEQNNITKLNNDLDIKLIKKEYRVEKIKKI